MTSTFLIPRCRRYTTSFQGLFLVFFLVTYMLLFRIGYNSWTENLSAEAMAAESDAGRALVASMKKYCIQRDELGETLIIATANMGNAEMLENWMASMSKNGYDRYFIISLDPHLLKALRAKGVQHTGLVPPNWLSEDGAAVVASEVDWDTPGYFQLTKSKNVIVRKLLGHGFNVIFTDVDLVWRSPHVLNYLNYYMSMHRWHEAVFALDAPFIQFRPEVNTGFYYVRSTKRVMALFDEAIRIQKKMFNTHDQMSMNSAYWSFKGVEGWVGFFEPALIMNGDHFFVHNVPTTLFGGMEPFVVHANYFIGLEAKKGKLEGAGLWYI